jgi:hypothetical protein
MRRRLSSAVLNTIVTDVVVGTDEFHAWQKGMTVPAESYNKSGGATYQIPREYYWTTSVLCVSQSRLCGRQWHCALLVVAVVLDDQHESLCASATPTRARLLLITTRIKL